MKGKRTDLSMAPCAIARSLEIVGDWWSLLIIREAFLGRERFGEFHKSLALAKNILSARLKKLVDAQILTIEPDPDSSLSRRYVLTPKGEALIPVLVALYQWGAENCFDRDELEFVMVDDVKGKPLVKLQPMSQDGRPLRRKDIRFAPRNLAASSPPARQPSKRRRTGAKS